MDIYEQAEFASLVRTQQNLTLCSAEALIILFRGNIGELATMLADESEVFCFLAVS